MLAPVTVSVVGLLCGALTLSCFAVSESQIMVMPLFMWQNLVGSALRV